MGFLWRNNPCIRKLLYHLRFAIGSSVNELRLHFHDSCVLRSNGSSISLFLGKNPLSQGLLLGPTSVGSRSDFWTVYILLSWSNHREQQLTPLNWTSPYSEAWGSLDTIEVLSRTGNKGKGTSLCAAALIGLPMNSWEIEVSKRKFAVCWSFLQFWSEVLRGFRLPQRSSKKVLCTFWLAPWLGFVQSLITCGWPVTSVAVRATADVGKQVLRIWKRGTPSWLHKWGDLVFEDQTNEECLFGRARNRTRRYVVLIWCRGTRS